jgi:ADP-ribose pyrophosphatase YjhB (NUDIX family)
MTESISSGSKSVPVADSASLRELLQAEGYDTDRWGVGATKTVEALWDEVKSGESELVEVEGLLVRRTYVAAIDVITQLDDGTRLKLYEEKQVFANGSVRERGLLTSLGEKMKPGEDIEAATQRAVKEELGIKKVVSLRGTGNRVLEKDTETYGGMPTQLFLQFAEVEIATEDYKPEGYVEAQPDKLVFFQWAAIDGEQPE